MNTYRVRVEFETGDVRAVEIWITSASPMTALEDVYRAMSAAYGIDKTNIKRIVEIEGRER